MAERVYGASDIRRLLIHPPVGEKFLTLTGSTHAVAARILASREEFAEYRVTDIESGVTCSVAFRYENMLNALELLADVGGETLLIDGKSVSFLPLKMEAD